MHKYAVAYSLLVISSLSTVSAGPFHVPRQNSAGGGGGGAIIGQPPITPTTPPATPNTPTTPPAVPGTGAPTTPPAVTTGPAQTSAPPATSAAPTAPTAPGSAAPSSAPPTSAAPTTPQSNTPATPTAPPTTQDSVTSVSTDPAGSVQTIVTVVSAASDASSASASPSPSSSDSDGDNSIKPGTIIGLSVAGGIAALAVIAFIIWKLTRKRFSDLDDPDEAIKWPELNRGSPVGGEGLSRQPSNTYSNGPSRNASTLDQSEYADPYAVPPLPQFNPNQPYRDDPAAGYYDPYRGPVPQTFHDGSVEGHESIPMSTYPPGSRTRSPGPGPSYDMGGRGSPAPGRASPAPGAMYDMSGRGSPAPGRTIDPGAATVLGLDRRPSPAPQQYAMGGQPEMVSRNRSPGPNILG